MGVGTYLLVGFFLLFAVVLKGFGRELIGVKTASLLVVSIPFILSKMLVLMTYASFNVSWTQAFQLPDVITLIAQLVIAYGLFRLLDSTEDAVPAIWLLAAVIGPGLLYLAVPYVVTLLLH